MRTAEQRPWFAAKRYGWGWSPATWQGWLCTAACLVPLFACTLLWGMRIGFAAGVAGIAVLTAIAYRTGEPPRWRWGDKD